MSELIFDLILNNEDGDYLIQATILAEMKPTGW